MRCAKIARGAPIRDESGQPTFVERATKHLRGLATRRAWRDDLAEHRVVMNSDLAAGATQIRAHGYPERPTRAAVPVVGR